MGFPEFFIAQRIQQTSSNRCCETNSTVCRRRRDTSNRRASPEIQIKNGQINSKSISVISHSSMLSNVQEVLIEHTDPETFDLETSDYFQGLIQTFSEPEFRLPLNIATVFPRTSFHGFHAALDEQKRLCFKRIAEPAGPEDFWLIIRSHEHHIDTLRDYLASEFAGYDKLTLQANHLVLIGIAPLPPADVTLVVFLTLSIQTVESQREALQAGSRSVKAA
jgi:hypothetical protein